MNRNKLFGRFVPGIKSLVLIVSACSSVVSFGVSAQEGAIASQLPAIRSNKASESLLQDIVRVGDKLVAVGERGHIIYSETHGKSWQQADVPTRAMLNAVFFVSSDKGWAVGYDGLVLNTVDGGKSWSMQLDGLKFTRKRMADRIPVLEDKLKDLEEKKTAADDDLAAAEEGGEENLTQYEEMVDELEEEISTLETELEDARTALSDTVANPLMDVWFRDENNGFVVGAFGEFLKTEDGGVTWSSISESLDNDDRHHLNAIAGRGNLMFISGEAGHIYRSNDGGGTWSLLESPDPENGSFFTVNIISDEEVLVAGLRGAIYRSVDQGDSWKHIPEDLHKNMNSAYFTGNDTVLAVGNDGAFLRSRDGGRTFLSHVRKNRLTLSSVVEAADGSYVLVGAGGVQLVSPDSL